MEVVKKGEGGDKSLLIKAISAGKARYRISINPQCNNGEKGWGLCCVCVCIVTVTCDTCSRWVALPSAVMHMMLCTVDKV